MASRTGPSIPGRGRPLTYGKASRKRHLDSIPLRTAETHASSSDRPAAPGAEDVARPPRPRPTTDSSPKPSAGSHSSSQISRDRVSTPQGRNSQPRDDASSKKRKRPQTTSSTTLDDKTSTASPGRPKPPIVSSRPRIVAPVKTSSSSLGIPRRIMNTENQKIVVNRSRSVDGASPSTLRRKPPLGTAVPPLKKTESQGSNAGTRRPRLIDALAAQRPNSPDSDSSMGDDEPTQSSLFSRPATPSQRMPTLARDDSITRPRARPGTVSHGKRVKFTYGESRSILNDSQKTTDSGVASCEDELDALLATPPELSQPDPFSFGDDDLDEDGDVRPAIKSVHELRRAGANNRFADEMEDLLARIGNPSTGPSSMRRNALLELAQKLQRKDFIAQFRDHATRDKVAINIGEEEDVVSAFALVSILITFLNFTSAAHLIPQLSQDGLGKMLGRLLLIPEDIGELAAQKKMRLSGASRKSVGEVRTFMMRKDIWHGRRLEKLSPQTLALQLLHVLCRIDPGYSSGVVKDAKNELILTTAGYTDDDLGDNTDFALIVSILESQSTLTMDGDSDVSWILHETSKVAQFLSNALCSWSEKPTELQSKLLKLAINTSNTAQGAAGLNDGVLLSRLSTQICLGFKSAQEAVTNRRLRSETYDGLLLILGVTINIVEHCAPARENVDGESLEGLMALYLQNQASTSEADSVEKSQLSVAVGYLAVLLGYLSLVGPVRRRLTERTGGKGVSGLIGSIQEFIRMYRSVDSKVHELEGLVIDLQQLRRMPG